MLLCASFGLLGPPVQAEADRQASALVRQLGSSSFRQREMAARALVTMGGQSRKALEGALKHPERDVRECARRLLSEAADFESRRQIARFEADRDGSAGADLPGWTRFRKAVGSDAAPREFFAVMFRNNLDLLRELERDPARTARACSRRCHEMRLEIEATARASQIGVTSSAEPSDYELLQFAALMFASMDDRVRKARIAINRYPDGEVDYPVAELMNEPCFGFFLRYSRLSPTFGKLFSYWLDNLLVFNRRRDDFEIQAALMAIRTARISEAAGFVERVVQKTANSKEIRTECLLCLGLIGEKKHLAMLEPFLKNTINVSTFRGGPKANTTYKAEMRDVALAMTILLSGEKPSLFGFEGMKLFGGGDDKFESYSFAFTSEDNRKAAFEKWNEHARQKGLASVEYVRGKAPKKNGK